MKPLPFLLAGLFTVGPLACDRGDTDPAPATSPQQGFGELTVEQVAERIGEPGVHLFDNNRREEWEKGHLPGATWLDYNDITASDLPPNRDATLIFYCFNEH